MTEPSHRMPRRIAIAALVGSVILLLLFGLEYTAQRFLTGTAAREAALTVPSPNPQASSHPLAVSVFDHPRPLPEIAFIDGDNHPLTLADFRGRVVLLNIWATWCVPCRKEMPTLDRLQAKLGGDDFIVIALSIDRDGLAAVKRFYRETGVEKLGIYLDPSGRGTQGLALPGVPTTLLIDREGREVARKMGEAEWDGSEMVSLIRRTIAARDTKGAAR